MSDPPLIGRGRAADVYDLGGGRVLRRYRTAAAGDAALEARAMKHLRAHGAPVPEVFEADGADLVMERLDGPTMLDTVKAKPWRARAIGRQLSQLQAQIHRVPVDGLELRRRCAGDAILHLDLHPDNVIVTARGPVVIDWSNVALGDPLADAMYSWMVMVTSSPDGVPLLLRPALQRVRRSLTDGFVERTPLDDAARAWVTWACEQRLLDPNTRTDEAVRVRALAASEGRIRPS
jgi:aminoglycoside phosphotransferase (APT) family kinase protein